MSTSELPAPEVTTEQTAEALQRDITLLDVREDNEFQEVHIPGAVHIPLGELLNRHGEIDQTKPVYVVCAVGGRSMAAAGALRQLGFAAVSIAGGTNLWASEGRATASGAS